MFWTDVKRFNVSSLRLLSSFGKEMFTECVSQSIQMDPEDNIMFSHVNFGKAIDKYCANKECKSVEYIDLVLLSVEVSSSVILLFGL